MCGANIPRMKALEAHPVAAAGALTVALAAVFELTEISVVFLLGLMGIILFVGLVWGPRLPLFVRSWFTWMIFYFGALACMFGRTMAPGLTLYTAGMALLSFSSMALLPALALLRLWHGRRRLALIGLVLPVSLLLGCVVGFTEERLFIWRYRETGAGPTPRWTVEMHWLAYDPATGELAGSD
ncbi:MAG TPA: hypothetical protein PLS90_06755 [Candidatus Sumerlaeota bacterium]|nr:hypothetical protein [Candidatus Sumerlaeota bacterium]HOR26987.1 hypothetical protein [Candidatus Sumerlaeota bacterium]HPK02141.1 hypothetical protein [Candidatus Sumerlaeota bacterium]